MLNKKRKERTIIISCCFLLIVFQGIGFPQKVTLPNSDLDNTFKDERDGQTYQTITVNNKLGMGIRKIQTWLAENLQYETKSGSWYYDNDEKKNRKYGRLYTWESAKKACPEGWRLPTDVDWQILMHQFAKGGLYFKEKELYKTLIEGGNSGFAALLGGQRYNNGDFLSLGKYGIYWSATEQITDGIVYYSLDSDRGQMSRNFFKGTTAFSCRCIKN